MAVEYVILSDSEESLRLHQRPFAPLRVTWRKNINGGRNGISAFGQDGDSSQ